VAQTLLENGFKDVHALYGGFEAWQKENGVVEPKRDRARAAASEEERRDERRA
jgi:hypothetical protein